MKTATARVLITCQLGKMRIPLQFDIGFEDIITPAVCSQKWSDFLDYEDIYLATYPMETVVAEKLEAAVSLGINNSRMKDFLIICTGCRRTLNSTGAILRKRLLIPLPGALLSSQMPSLCLSLRSSALTQKRLSNDPLFSAKESFIT